MTDSHYLTTRQVADILGLVSTTNVVRLIEKGMLPCERIRLARGGRRLYHPTTAELAQYLEAYDPALLPRMRYRLQAADIISSSPSIHNSGA